MTRATRRRNSLWTEGFLLEMAVSILPWGTAEQNGVALWSFPGLGKRVKSDTHLWHDTASEADYRDFARALKTLKTGEKP